MQAIGKKRDAKKKKRTRKELHCCALVLYSTVDRKTNTRWKNGKICDSESEKEIEECAAKVQNESEKKKKRSRRKIREENWYLAIRLKLKHCVSTLPKCYLLIFKCNKSEKMVAVMATERKKSRWLEFWMQRQFQQRNTLDQSQLREDKKSNKRKKKSISFVNNKWCEYEQKRKNVTLQETMEKMPFISCLAFVFFFFVVLPPKVNFSPCFRRLESTMKLIFLTISQFVIIRYL